MNYDFIDLHVHSEYSSCAEDVSVAWWVELARGGARFALTDHSAHIFFPPDRKWGLWTDEARALFEANREAGAERIRAYLRHVRSVQCGGMLIGTELDIMPDGRVVCPQELLGTLDVVLGAVHAMPTIRHQRPPEEVEAEFRFQVQTFAQLGVHALAHPFRILLAADYPVSDELLAWTVQVAADAGMALEINNHKPFPEHDVAMVRLALERGAKLVVGTDAHRRAEFGEFSYHEQILQRAGVDAALWRQVSWRPTLSAASAAAAK